MYRDISEAHDALSNPETKARYDRGEDVNEPQGHGGNPFHGFHSTNVRFHHQGFTFTM